MADLEPVARMMRWAARDYVHQLEQLPEDRLDWKPDPASKSALEITAEVIGVMRLMEPVFRGEEAVQIEYPRPANLEEAKARVLEAASVYAAALKNAGPELEHPTPTPVGELWAPYAVLFPLIDMLHHHGQLSYLQSLLGDATVHMDRQAILDEFGVPA